MWVKGLGKVLLTNVLVYVVDQAEAAQSNTVQFMLCLLVTMGLVAVFVGLWVTSISLPSYTNQSSESSQSESWTVECGSFLLRQCAALYLRLGLPYMCFGLFTVTKCENKTKKKV